MNRSERILIVEDERLIALDLQRRLERYSFIITAVASTAQDAVIQAENTVPDLILMDISLKGEKDGIDAALEIKEKQAIPVIFVTSYSDEKTLERAKTAEPFGYILKPFKEKELIITIENALYKHRIDRKLVKHERWFSAILKNIGDGLIATDRKRNIQFMNPVAEELTGWLEKDAANRHLASVFTLLHTKTGLQIRLPWIDTNSCLYKPLFFNDIILDNRVGAKIHIEGSVAEIIEDDGESEGLVIAFRDITHIKAMTDTLSYHQSHDTLTGLANRDEFFQKLSTLTHDAKTRNLIHSFMYLDLDQFKIVNDIAGHIAGDELLRQVSADIKAIIPDSTLCARLGGDEFGILLPGTTLREAQPIAQKLLSTLNHKFIWQKNLFTISASISLVPINAKTPDVYSALAAADDACYLAKEEGGNRIKVYENSDNQFLKRRGDMQWISRLTRALEENTFCLFYQPIVPLKNHTDSRKKYEILLRLKSTDDNCIQPVDFIPPAEKYNLMPVIDRWVIRETMKFFVRVHKNGSRSGERLYCINISGASLADQSLLGYILEQFRETGADPASFCFEMTETTAMSNLTLAERFMNKLRMQGCTFSLDDFGSGFSSLTYLKNLPVDFLKIDGAFVKDIQADPIDCAMVEAINNIGHVMGLETIAEFVTDSSIRAKLVMMGVDYAQGFAIGQPRPLQELAESQD